MHEDARFGDLAACGFADRHAWGVQRAAHLVPRRRERRSEPGHFPKLPESSTLAILHASRLVELNASNLPGCMSFSRRRLPPWNVDWRRRLATPAKRVRLFAPRMRSVYVVSHFDETNPIEANRNLVFERLARKCAKRRARG